MRRLTLLVALISMTIGARLPVSAQEDVFARYADIPFERAEDGAFVLGSADAPVTIVEFADFMCPHCQVYQSTVHEFIDTYVRTGEARFEYRFFPVVHPTYSVFTAQLAECTEVQQDGVFWPVHDLLYEMADDGQIGPDTPETIAEAVGIDAEKLEACIDTAVQWEVDEALGQSVGVSGTPATMIRTSDDALGWAFLQGQLQASGGLPLSYLTEVLEADNLLDIVIVPTQLLGDLVDETVCSAPCWRSITPGETPFEDVADLIRAEPQFVEISENTSTDQTQSVSWRTFNSLLSDPNFILSGEDGTVEVISLIDISVFGLGEVLDVQGEPKLALAVDGGEIGAIVYAIFPEKSLIVLVLATVEEGLAEDSPVIGAQYLAPDIMTEVVSEGVAVVWTGYDGLSDYLR